MQHGKMIAYVSCQLEDYEKRYPTYDLELATFVFALKIWRHCLYGIHCDIYTDHKTLKYLFTQKELNVCQGRWLELLTDYDFDIHYYPEKANREENALSRKSTGTLIAIQGLPEELQNEIRDFDIQIITERLAALQIQLILLDQIRKA